MDRKGIELHSLEKVNIVKAKVEGDIIIGDAMESQSADDGSVLSSNGDPSFTIAMD